MTASSQIRVTVREARDDDDLDALNVGNPLWFSEAQERRTAAAAPPGSVTMLVGERDGAPVGWGFAIGAAVAAGGCGVANVWVPSGQRRRLIGGALLAHLEEFVRGAGCPGVMVTVPDTEPDGLAVARHLGLDERGHHVESVLDVTSMGDDMVAQALAKLAAAGIRCPSRRARERRLRSAQGRARPAGGPRRVAGDLGAEHGRDAAILAVNARLGFRPVGGYRDLGRTFSP